jgi:hypothetical protein
MIINKETKEKIYKEFVELRKKTDKSVTEIRKSLANTHQIGLTSVRRLTKNFPTAEQTITSKENKKNSKYPQTYIFTSWDIRIKVSNEFVDILKQLEKYYNAKVHILPLNKDDLIFLPPILKDFIIVEDIKSLNSNFQAKYVKTNPLATEITNGWTGVFEETTVLPGLIKDLRTEKSVNLCKQVISAGSIGTLDVSYDDYDFLEDEERKTFNKKWLSLSRHFDGKNYAVSKEFIEPTAIIVDIKDDKIFFPRYVSMKVGNKFIYDKNLKFTCGKTKPLQSNPAAIIYGDFHSIELDEPSFEATKQMTKKWKPNAIVLNDFVSFSSINRYEWDDYIKVINAPTLEEEQTIANKHLDEICQLNIDIYYIQSNHCNFLTRYMAWEDKFKLNTHNYIPSLELRLWSAKTKKHPIIKFLDLENRKNVKFISERENLYIAGVLTKHGHESLAGAQVGFRAYVKAYNKYVQGHLHAIEQYRNGGMAGTLSKLDLGYVIGSNSWLNGNLLIQPDSTIQTIPIIYGEFEI